MAANVGDWQKVIERCASSKLKDCGHWVLTISNERKGVLGLLYYLILQALIFE